MTESIYHTSPRAMRGAVRRAKVVYISCIGRCDPYNIRIPKTIALEALCDEQEGNVEVCEESNGVVYIDSLS